MGTARGGIRISKQLVCQRYIFKIHSVRLRKERWNLSLSLEEARKNDEVISLADSQILRWIDELNGITNADAQAMAIRSEIRRLKKEPNAAGIGKQIRKKYAELDQLQFKPDYMCLIIDKEKDYHRACKGFSINGIKYKRLLGTNGGIKNSTIVFVSERLVDELKRRIDNGRDPNKAMVTAKLEAYKALTCSASIPVSLPEGILVVPDAETQFYSDIIYLTDENDGEPIMEERENQLITLDATDGFGLMCPELASRWSEELGLDYMTCGLNSRFAFTKGMVYTFDFVDFAESVAGSYAVTDAWGNEVDIRDIELILTTSMVKLWDSYGSCDEFIKKSLKNGYTFAVTKTCPEELENVRNLNYQFIQSFPLDDDDIDELIAPTMNEISDVLCGDWRKTVLFLKGMGLNERNIDRQPNDFVKAIMIDQDMLEDPYTQNQIYQLIRNRIDEAKVGVVKVHGNFSMASGDPYLLCQSIFGLEKTGLLKSGEIYNKYWLDNGAINLVCFRAPMTTHHNIRSVQVARRHSTDYWYRYMNTCTIFNAWDTSMAALNGMDYDGDMVMLTDNPVLVRRHTPLPTLMCVQRKGAKILPQEEDFIRSNIESFGNDIGRTTNWGTSMFEVRSKYPVGSKEYEALSYRIMVVQLCQQNAIDKAKGIISKPMPRSWHDRYAAGKIEDENERELYRSIVADKKPYFMRYIYPALMRQYNTYMKNVNRNTLREFGLTIDELCALPDGELTDRQREFLWFFHNRMPVGTSDCVMNKICRKFEERFDGYISRHKSTGFDYNILKNDAEYTPKQYSSIKHLYDDYNKRLYSYSVFADYERVDKDDYNAELALMDDEFRKECDQVCQNRRALCNIVLDICYNKKNTKKFAWNMCGDEIIENLLEKNDYTISYPTMDPDGDIDWGGFRFCEESKRIEEDEWE